MATSKLNIPALPGSCGKVRYHSTIELCLAEEELAIRDRARGLEPRKMRRYYCSQCKAWHLTSTVAR
jgi:hypothetical protein